MFGKTDVRPQHYGFAHFALRQFAFENPGYCLTVLLSPKGQELVELLWSHVQQFCDEKELDPSLSPKQIKIFPALLMGNRGVILQMPEPLYPTEAYFVALLPLGKPAQFHYFTLELAPDGEVNSKVAICEWTKDDRHINYGESPLLSAHTFLGAIAERFAPLP